LLCIENLKLIGEKAHRVKQYLQDKVETLMLERSRLKAIVDEEATKRTEFVTVTGRIESATKQIDDLDVQLYDLQKQINECDIQVGMETKRLEEKAKIDQELKAREAERVELETDQKAKVRDTNEKVVALTTKISDAQALADKRPTVQKYIDAKDGFETSLVTAREEVKKHDAEIDRITGEIGKIQETETTLAGLEKDLLSIKSAGKVAVDNAQRKRDAAVKEGDKLAKSPCTSCAAKKSEMVLSKVLGGQAPCDKCKFVSDALIEWNKLSEYEAVLTEALKADPRENGITARIDNLKKTISGKTILQKELAWKRTEKSGAQSRVTDLETKLSNAQKALGMLPRIELAEHQLPELRKEKATVEEENVQAEEKMQAKIEALDFIITELSLSLIETTVTGPTWAQQKDGCVTAMAEIKLKIDEIRTQSETDSKAVGAIEQSLSEIGKATVDLEGISQKIEYLNDEISQWATLEKAFGNDGIIALELDDAGPQVATVANELLKEYGGRFQVRIDTQIAKADGKGNKEVFDISVFDNETNEVKSIRKMSGGEKTWIEDSMTKAIALYLASSSGRRYEATFSDEKDGALDPTKKKEFFAAMRRAMELGGYRNLFTITQTPELQSMADAVIRLERGKVEIIIQ
jgi:exonuclease SbcC